MSLRCNKPWKSCSMAMFLAAVGFALAQVTAAVADTPEKMPKIDRKAAMERLQGDYSLEGVARKHIEVEFDDLKGLSQPLTQRTAIQAKNHPDTVLRHPDLSLVLGAPADSFCRRLRPGRSRPAADGR